PTGARDLVWGLPDRRARRRGLRPPLAGRAPFLGRIRLLLASVLCSALVPRRLERPGLARPGGVRPPPPTEVSDRRRAVCRGPWPDDWLKWYLNVRIQFGHSDELVAARWPSVLLGALGCVAVYALGVLVGDARVGGLAALLLMLNPLYRLHARRAMSDVPVEA